MALGEIQNTQFFRWRDPTVMRSNIFTKQSHLIPSCSHLSWGPSCIITREWKAAVGEKLVLPCVCPWETPSTENIPMCPWQMVLGTIPSSCRAQPEHGAAQPLCSGFTQGTLTLADEPSNVHSSEEPDEHRGFRGLGKASIPQNEESVELKHFTALSTSGICS